MKIYKIYVYSSGKSFYFKHKSGMLKKKEKLEKINKYDLYVVDEIEMSIDK